MIFDDGVMIQIVICCNTHTQRQRYGLLSLVTLTYWPSWRPRFDLHEISADAAVERPSCRQICLLKRPDTLGHFDLRLDEERAESKDDRKTSFPISNRQSPHLGRSQSNEARAVGSRRDCSPQSTINHLEKRATSQRQ